MWASRSLIVAELTQRMRECLASQGVAPSACNAVTLWGDRHRVSVIHGLYEKMTKAVVGSLTQRNRIERRVARSQRTAVTVLLKTGRLVRSVSIVVGLALLAFPAIAADTPAPASSGSAYPTERVIDLSGNFIQSIPIDVPQYHGLQPTLSLRYNSGASGGFLGVGWSFSAVSRQSSGHLPDGAHQTSVLLWAQPRLTYTCWMELSLCHVPCQARVARRAVRTRRS